MPAEYQQAPKKIIIVKSFSVVKKWNVNIEMCLLLDGFDSVAFAVGCVVSRTVTQILTWDTATCALNWCKVFPLFFVSFFFFSRNLRVKLLFVAIWLFLLNDRKMVT